MSHHEERDRTSQFDLEASREHRDKTANVGVTIALATTASLCASVLTDRLEGTSEAAVWVAAVVGAALPPLITTVGPWHHLRVGVAVAITVTAVALTYLAAASAARVKDEPSIFHATAQPIPGLHLRIKPTSSRCTVDSGCQDVKVTSTGTSRLGIRQIEIAGDDAGDFVPDEDCEDRTLRFDQSCEVSVTFNPGEGSATRNAILVIHQNLPGPPSYVQLTGEVEAQPGGPDIALSVQGCNVVIGGGLTGGDVLTVTFRVRTVGEPPYEPGATVSAESDTGFRASVGVPVRSGDDSTSDTFQVEFGGQDYGKTHTFTVVATPDTVIGEPTDNNQLPLLVTLPAQRPTDDFDPC